MQLLLQNGGKQRRLIVQLVEGHIPKISDLSNDETKSITENLEPAIWFKVMVVESIHIDCLKKVVEWTNGMKDEDDNLILINVYGSDRSCYDFDDDVDELFNLANFLIEKNPLLEKCEKNRLEQVIEYERSVIRMLHCYVLGKVILQPCDLECVQNALTAQKKTISQLEDTVLVHSRLADHYLSQMRNIRELEILPVLEQLIEGAMVGQEFIEGLLVDLKKVELAVRDEVDVSQKAVDDIKEKLKNSKSAHLSHELECARHERNHLLRNLQLHLVGRELCRTIHITEEREMNENCVRYMKIRKRVLTEKGIANFTIEKKLRAVSVRECIEGVLKELEIGEDATGDDVTVDGQRVTDVGENCAPEWQTLTQRLSCIVYNRDHPVGIAFHDFCVGRQTYYREILRSIEFLASGPATDPSTYGDFYVISEKDFGLTTLFLQNQRNMISSHIYQVTELLAEGFRNSWNMFVRKIRLCYEKCFYKRIGRELMLMYRLVYAKAMQALEERIAKLKTLEIYKLDLQMRSEWWLELFEMDGIDDSDLVNGSTFNSTLRGYATESEAEFDAKADFTTDFEEEEYSDLGRKIGTVGMKDKLLASKRQVMSRSCLDLCSDDSSSSEDPVKNHSRMFEDEMMHRANLQNPHFKSNMMAGFIDDTNLYGMKNRSCSSSPDLMRSNSISSIVSPRFLGKQQPCVQPHDTFELHFGHALRAIKSVFLNPSPLRKMQCLTAALKLIANKVEELRMRDQDEAFVDRAEIAVTAEDLLPLLVLLILKLVPCEAAKLYVDLIFVSDLMAEFLSSGCHSYALCEFQIAFLVLDQTCEELGIGEKL